MKRWKRRVFDDKLEILKAFIGKKKNSLLNTIRAKHVTSMVESIAVWLGQRSLFVHIAILALKETLMVQSVFLLMNIENPYEIGESCITLG
jgi:hypothetical protein